MKSKQDIDQLAEQILNSLDGIERAETQPFFYTRLMARMEGSGMNQWNRWMAFLSKPAVSLALLFVFLMINGFLIFNKLESQKEVSGATSDYAQMQVAYLDPNPDLP